MRTLIVIPTYNESENIKPLVKEIFFLGVSGLEVLIIDDSSTDGTGQLAEELTSILPVKVIHRPGKQGLGTAYLLGFAYAIEHGFEVVFEMDADFSHNPSDIPKLLAGIAQGYDLVLGSRRVNGGKIVGWSWHRHLASWGANTLSCLCLRLKTKDVTAGFRAYLVSALKK